MKIAFVTNFCPHYRIKTFELLATKVNVDYYFFSEGDEWYWQRSHGVQQGNFHSEYVPGFSIRGTRLTPNLAPKLWQGNYDIFIKCINGKFALPATFAIAQMQHKPFILWTGIWQRLETPIHQLIFPLTRYIYQHADAVVTYGEHVRKYLMTEKVNPQKIFVAQHAVDNPTYNRFVSALEKKVLREKLSIAPTQAVILYLGRLEEGKGVEYLLNALSKVTDSDAVLVLAGAGSWKEKLETQVTELNLNSKVRFAGYVPTAEAIAYYSIAAVTVVPSYATLLFREPWGLVVNESFNQGTPVIATETVGAAAGGLIENEKNGLIVPEKDAEALTEAINRILSEPGFRIQCSNNARHKIASWDNLQMVQGFLSAIQYVSPQMYHSPRDESISD